MIATVTDEEFGVVTVKRIAKSKHIRIRMRSDGTLRATIPPGGTMHDVTALLDSSREELRSYISEKVIAVRLYLPNQPIGASHHLTIRTGNDLKVKLKSPEIQLSLPESFAVEDSIVQAQLKPIVKKALQVESRAYLERRLRYLADLHGFTYQKMRLSTASTRWGSCSSSGTISLNIGLMQLDPALIDYVLYHELSHTRYMNHSKIFWQLVESLDSDFRLHRKSIKQYQPFQ